MSNEEFLPFSRPSISQEAIDEVVACLKSGWITTGPRLKKFEDDLKAYCGAPHALALSSATAGLHLVMAALELKPGEDIHIEFGKSYGTLAQIPGASFYHRLRERFGRLAR